MTDTVKAPIIVDLLPVARNIRRDLASGSGTRCALCGLLMHFLEIAVIQTDDNGSIEQVYSHPQCAVLLKQHNESQPAPEEKKKRKSK